MQTLKKKQQHKYSLDPAEKCRLKSLMNFEEAARQLGYSIIAGIDEAGRGPLAGPVVAAACIVPQKLFISGVDDSKKVTPAKRAEIFAQIKNESSICYGIGIVSWEEIDRINIYQATIKAMLAAVAAMQILPEYLLVDGLALAHPSIPVKKIIKGDQLSYSIALASIIAKETRDALMCEYHTQWPEYGFNQHKGYGTTMHLDAIEKHGPCPIHRLSFSPLSNVNNK